MLNEHELRNYRRLRRETPLLAARYALSIIRSRGKSHDWTETGHDTWTMERDGFFLTLTTDVESIYPAPGDGFGEYVDEVRGWTSLGGHDEWGGNYREPRLDDGRFPLGLPYTAFRYTGATQGDGGYFVPDEIEEQYDYYRREGQSKSVAWDLTRQWVEARISDYFGEPLSYVNVTITVEREGVELGSSTMGTTILDDWSYIFEMADEHGMVEDAIEEARDTLGRLCASR